MPDYVSLALLFWSTTTFMSTCPKHGHSDFRFIHRVFGSWVVTRCHKLSRDVTSCHALLTHIVTHCRVLSRVVTRCHAMSQILRNFHEFSWVFNELLKIYFFRLEDMKYDFESLHDSVHHQILRQIRFIKQVCWC